MDFRLKKQERIHNKNELKLLFEGGSSFLVHPFKVLYCVSPIAAEETNYPLKVAISIPKKRFKKAVDRNTLKRRSREAFRLNRNALKTTLNNKQIQLLLMLIYVSDKPLKYAQIEDKIILILRRLQEIHAKDNQ